MAMSNAVLEAALKAAIARLVTALANKDALNSLKLEGKTLAEITTLILAGKAATAGEADNALLLGGKDLATIQTEYAAAIAAAVAAAKTELEGDIAAIDKESIGLGNVENYGVATEAEALAGAADKYVTAFLAEKIAQAKIDALVGAAPETLDTINEIAAALQNDPDIINNLMTQIGTKETPAGAQAKADAAQAAAATDATTKATQALNDAKAYADSTKLGKTDQAADSAMLEGKTLEQILEMSGVTPDDFSIAPLNVFLGVDYVAMGASEVGEWSGPAAIGAMSGTTLLTDTGVDKAFLSVSVVEAAVEGVASKVVTRRVEVADKAGVGHTFVEIFSVSIADVTVKGTGFNELVTGNVVAAAIADAITPVQEQLDEVAADVDALAQAIIDALDIESDKLEGGEPA
ncbi:hypothetical protein D3C81_24260 [compost metagenome]